MMGYKEGIILMDTIKRLATKLEYLAFSILAFISPKVASDIRYKKILHRKCNFKKPTTFNERLMVLKLGQYYKNDLITECCDKYKVRKYVQRCGCEKILNELYFDCNDPNEISWHTLPSKYVIKCNHGCNYNIICTNSKELNIELAKAQLRKWMKEKYWLKAAETNYRFIQPKIIIEKYIETKAGKFPIDYRFYCTKGEVKTCLLMHYSNEGYEHHDSYHIYVDADYRPLDIGQSIAESWQLPEKPKNFEEMWNYAKILSKPFPFVRVDLYSCDGKTLFGELTFSPCGCTGLYNISPMLDEMFKEINSESIY